MITNKKVNREILKDREKRDKMIDKDNERKSEDREKEFLEKKVITK